MDKSVLPTEKRKPIKDLSQEIILGYGIPKVGKSTFFSHFANALFASTEQGLNHLEVFEFPIRNWDDFLKLVRELEKNPTQFQTVVIDTLDNLYLFCRQYIYGINTQTDKNGKTIEVQHETDMPYGKGWDAVDGEFRRQLTRLSRIKTMGMVMISHSEEKLVTRPGHRESETVIRHTLPARARKVINPMADMILYMGVENGKRKIFTKPTQQYEAGDRSGKLPAVLPLDYETFVNAYYGGGEDGDSSKARTEIIKQIRKGFVTLAEQKIDGFEVEKRVHNSLQNNLGTTDLNDDNLKLGDLQAYLQKLRAKFRTNGGTK